MHTPIRGIRCDSGIRWLLVRSARHRPMSSCAAPPNMRPVSRDRRVPRDPEPPVHLRALTDSHPGPAIDLTGRPLAGTGRSQNPELRRRVARVGPVQPTADADRLAEPGRTAGKVTFPPERGTGSPRPRRSGAPDRRQRRALDHPASSQQDGGSISRWPADQVHAEVHSVGEVDIRVPGLAEHHRIASGLPAKRVRRRIDGAGIRLDLGQPDRDHAISRLMHEHAAKQVRRHGQHRPGKERPRQHLPPPRLP